MRREEHKYYTSCIVSISFLTRISWYYGGQSWFHMFHVITKFHMFCSSTHTDLQPATRLTDTNGIDWQGRLNSFSLHFLYSFTFNIQLRQSISGKFTCGTTCTSRLPIFEQSNEESTKQFNKNLFSTSICTTQTFSGKK